MISPLDPNSLVTNGLTWVLTIFVACALFVDVRRDLTRFLSARNVVLVAVFSWYLLEALQLPAEVKHYGREAYDFALVLVGLATWAFLQGYRELQTRLFDAVGARVARLDSRRRQWHLLLLAGIVGFTPVLIYGGSDVVALLEGVLGMRKTWGGPLGRATLGDFRSAVLMLESVIWGISWLAILFWFDRRNPPGARLFALLMVLWTLLRAYGSGSRSMMLSAVLVPLMAVFWLSGHRWRTRLVLLAPFVGVLFYGFSAVMVAGREQAELDFSQQPNYVGHEMFRELLFIVDEISTHRGYLWGGTYWTELLSPIPRFVWPDKPLRFGVEYASWHGFDTLGGGPNMSPGILGEMYANFGILGVVLCSLIGGVICRAWDRLRKRYADSLPVLMFYTAGLASLFLCGRSATLAIFFPMIAVYLCLVLMTGIRRGRRSRPASAPAPAP